MALHLTAPDTTLAALLAGLATLLACAVLSLAALHLNLGAGMVAEPASAQASAFGGTAADLHPAPPRPIETVPSRPSRFTMHEAPCLGSTPAAPARTCFESGAR